MFFPSLLLSEKMIWWRDDEDTEDKLCSWRGQPAVKFGHKKKMRGGMEMWLKWQFYGNMSANFCKLVIYFASGKLCGFRARFLITVLLPS